MNLATSYYTLQGDCKRFPCTGAHYKHRIIVENGLLEFGLQSFLMVSGAPFTQAWNREGVVEGSERTSTLILCVWGRRLTAIVNQEYTVYVRTYDTRYYYYTSLIFLHPKLQCSTLTCSSEENVNCFMIPNSTVVSPVDVVRGWTTVGDIVVPLSSGSSNT